MHAYIGIFRVLLYYFHLYRMHYLRLLVGVKQGGCVSERARQSGCDLVFKAQITACFGESSLTPSSPSSDAVSTMDYS